MPTTTPTSDIYFCARCRPWSTDRRLRSHRVIVEPDGTVRVWDPIGSLYTTLHALTPRALARIRREAEDVEPCRCGGCGEGFDGRTGAHDAVAGPLCPECAADVRAEED